MKRILSLLLTVVMLMGMLSMLAGAEGNAAFFFDGAGKVPTVNYFQTGYIHSNNGEDGATYMQRNRQTGEFDYTLVMDINFTDYAISSEHLSGINFIPLLSESNLSFHLTYSFTTKSFMMINMYMPGNNPNDGYDIFQEMKYDMKLNQWYEIALRFKGKVMTLYLNGVEMLSFDFATISDRYDWDYLVQNNNNWLINDSLFFCPIDVSFYMDNVTVYSGDYDIATGTATSTFITDTDFNGLNNAEKSFCDFYVGSDVVSRAADKGIEKVTYDRDFAANHSHQWAHDTANSSTVDCLNPGYDLYACSCGASEQRNYVEPLGHLPGLTRDTPIAATETNSGVEVKLCNRTGCFKPYSTIVPLTGTEDKALHLYSNGLSSVYNGYASASAEVQRQNDGSTISMDIMPVALNSEKAFTRIGANVGANDYNYFVGYKNDIGKLVIMKDDEICDESDIEIPLFEWREWTWVRDGLNIALYIDGVEALSIVMDEEVYRLIDAEDDTMDADEELECYFFYFQPYGAELLIDNLIVADPDYDMEHNTGVIYSAMDFTGSPEGYGADAHFSSDAFGFLPYDKASEAGYQVEAYGRPMENLVEIHRDMAMKIDCDYETGSGGGYSQLWGDPNNESINYNNDLVATDEVFALDFEYSFDFYAYDWCTDAEKLGEKSAMIGGVIGGESNNGFVGYDFLKQQAVIGTIASHSGGAYGADNSYADYTIEKDTWHNFKFKYYFDADNGELGSYLLSVYIDGKEVLTKNIGDYLTVQYYILFPTFVKGYLDNLTIKIGDKYYDDRYDFTNGFVTDTNGFAFGGTEWSLAEGGIADHAYEAVVYPASCVTDGYTVYNCSCGNGGNYTAYDQLATGHSWNNGVVTTEPTVDAEGVMTYTCGICGETKTEAIEKLAPEYTPGDVNDDGRIQASDQSTFGRALSGASITINAKAADVNADGRVQANDLNMLARRLSGASIELG